MTAEERHLLENVLDALDRVFDRQSSVMIDLWALVFATAEALKVTQHYQELERPTAELLALVRPGVSEKLQRDSGLIVTDKLRHYIAEVLATE